MNKQYFVSDVYLLDPNEVKFGELTTFNPVQSELEYEATKAHIKESGQYEPIFMVRDSYGNWICQNGRHRTRICKELGIQVKCINLNPDLNDIEIFQLCNMNVMSSRDYTISQRAIQALRYSKAYNISSIDAAKGFKVDKRQVTYAATIAGYGYESMLNEILDGKSVLIPETDRSTNSIEVLCKYLKKLGERNVVEDQSEKIKWKPDALIKTEAGKVWFYEKVERNASISQNHELIADYIELANYKFRQAV